MQVVGVLFGSQRHVVDDKKQEVNLRLYLCKPIFQIPDFMQVSFLTFHFRQNSDIWIQDNFQNSKYKSIIVLRQHGNISSSI